MVQLTNPEKTERLKQAIMELVDHLATSGDGQAQGACGIARNVLLYGKAYPTDQDQPDWP